MSGETIQLDHATGGLSRELVDRLIAPRVTAAHAGAGDGEALELDVARIAMTTDTFVVDPLFFDGGDIGRLAVCATVNDLATSGAVPRYLVLSLVIEQGLAVANLTRVLDSVREAAAEADVEVVAGDTQVVRAGEADKLFLAVAGVGEFAHHVEAGAERVRPGDAVIVTGALGSHGLQILALREGLDGAARVPSDCAPLAGLVWNVLEDYAPQVRCMRDLGRGGLVGVLGELAYGAGVSVELEEHRLPIAPEARTVARRLGGDPLHLPSGASVCLVVDGGAATDVLELIRWQPQGTTAQIVGTVRERGGGAVTMVGPDGGGELVLEPLLGGVPARLR
jgi:hydrogenase expression/formation protein HypE